MNGERKPGKIRRGICWVFGLIMLFQIGWSVIWMAQNFYTLPDFGDTKEYVQLSETMELDEYRPVLYPLFLRFVRKIGGDQYYSLVYVIQTLLSVLSTCFAAYAVDAVRNSERMNRSWNNVLRWGFCGLYLNSIPMVTFMNFTILTDSLANSFLVLGISLCVLIIYGKEPTWLKALGIVACWICQSLLRADRFYSCFLLLIILFLLAMKNNPGRRKVIAIGTACILALNVGAVLAVRKATQVTGRQGRVETNFSFVLLDRVVWPNMAVNYDDFPEEIKAVITPEEAKTFDNHNNNVMYMMAPMLEEKVGREKAQEYYRTMARIIWKNMPGKVLGDIGEDLWTVITIPLEHDRTIRGLPARKTNIGWNIKHCMSMKTPELTLQYDKNGFFVLMGGLILGMLAGLLDLHVHQWRKALFPIVPYVLSVLILILWFTLGDGAPPNDRYFLMLYLVYALMPWMVVFRGTIV